MEILKIENKKGKITLNDAVHKESADQLIHDLGQLFGASAVLAQMSIGDVVCAADDALEGVEVEINSPGGSVFEGHRIYNSLREMSARGVPVTTTVNGLAASMGSVILLAGDTRQMTKGSRIMIHEASTMAQGDSKSLRKTADMLEGISAEIAGIYAERTGGEKDAIRDLMHAETWMDAKQAKEAGFVQSIVGEKQEEAAAQFDTKPKGMTGILSKLFPGNDDAAKFEAEIAENETLRNELTEAQAKITELSGHAELIVSKDSEIIAHLAMISLLEASSKQESEEAQAEIAELKSTADESAEAIAQKASTLLASTGHPEPVDTSENAEAPTDAYTEYRNLQKNDPRAAAEYWTANEDKIKSL